MKPTLKYITFGLICAGLTFAQTTTPAPSNMLQRQVQHLTKELTLNSSQQAQATTIFTTEQTANQPIMSSLKTAHTSLAAAIKSNNAADIATISGQIGTLEGQMLGNASTASAAIYGMLTSDQQAKYHVNAGFAGHGGFHGRGDSGQ